MKLPFQTDQGAAHKARLGLILLQSDETVDHELPAMLGSEGVIIHQSRVKSAEHVTNETLAAMAEDIPRATSLLPQAAPYHAIAYACTSGATIIGEAKIKALIQSVAGPVPVTNPLTAIRKKLQHLGTKRLGFVTPYIAEVSQAMRAVLEADGIEITSFGSFEQSKEKVVARITPDAIRQAIITTAKAAPCDAVFASCTNLRCLPILHETSKALGVPVLSSNSALAWDLARLSGIEE